MNQQIDLLDVYRMLRDDWRWLVGITAVFAVVSIIVALTATKFYRAEVVIVPVAAQEGGGAAALAQQFGGLAGMAGIDLGALSGGGDQISLPYLQSRALVEEFIQRNELLPVLGDDAEQMPTLWFATRNFMNGIRAVLVDPTTGLITVSIEWTDPVVAAEWANALVAMANENLRERALNEAERNIAYLNERIARTNVVGLQQAMYNLIESEMKTVMLANVRAEYAFSVVDPAVPPELRVRPKRSIMVIVATVVGGLFALLFVGLRRAVVTLRERDQSRSS